MSDTLYCWQCRQPLEKRKVDSDWDHCYCPTHGKVQISARWDCHICRADMTMEHEAGLVYYYCLGCCERHGLDPFRWVDTWTVPTIMNHPKVRRALRDLEVGIKGTGRMTLPDGRRVDLLYIDYAVHEVGWYGWVGDAAMRRPEFLGGPHATTADVLAAASPA